MSTYNVHAGNRPEALLQERCGDMGSAGPGPKQHSAHPEAQVPFCPSVRRTLLQGATLGPATDKPVQRRKEKIEDMPAVLCASDARTAGEHQDQPTHSKRSLRNHPESAVLDAKGCLTLF